MKKNILFLLIALIPFVSLGQTATIKGVVKDAAGMVVPSTVIKVLGTDIQTVTDSTGAYTLQNVPYGQAEIQVGDGVNVNASEKIEVEDAEIILNITSHASGAESISAGASLDIPTLSLSDDDLKEEGASGSVSSILSGARDPFTSASSFVFSIARFRVRGYDSDNFPTLLNGAILTDLANNRSEYNVWSGLNDVVRTRDNSVGLAPTDYSFGEVGGVNSIDSRASQQRKQLQVSYASSNRAYDNRIVITYGSGIGLKGWSYSISYSRRWSDEGYIPGTFYDGNSFFGSLEKKINSRNALALTLFAAKTKNGRSSPVIQELYDLAGTNYYNKNWGYHNGKKRTATVGDNFQPVLILTHDWAINDKSSLLTAVSFQTGKNKYSNIDWYNATDPRPDYYRKLPSFDPAYGANPEAAAQDSAELASIYMNNPDLLQIDWHGIYEANQIHDTGQYVLSNSVTDGKRYGFNTIYNNDINENLVISGGLSYQLQDLNFYKQLDDMLGAKYFLNLNQFADQTTLSDPDVLQNDLNNPNAILKEGDKYGYDYVAHIYKSSIWAQSVFKFEKVDFFLAAQLTMSGFYRTGNTRYGVFKNNSFGDSPKYNFTDPAFKSGITYKINGRNYVYVNSAYIFRAPLFENTFVSPRTRALAVSNPESEKITSIEGGYLYRAPRLKARATGYLTQFNDITDIRSFYYEDFTTFVNYTLTGINKRHAGIELAVEAGLGHGITATAVAAIGEFVYTDRPMASGTQDNKDTLLFENMVVYSKNLHVSGGPQSAYTIGLNYRSKNFWFLSVNVNYFDNIYIDYNPVRRTIPSLEYIDEGTPAWEKVLGQEKRDGEFTLDASAGWSWKFDNKFKSLKKNAFLLFNVGLSNILDNKDLIVTGFEQLRFDRGGNPDVYPAKYAYAYGRTYFASITLRFN